MEDAGEQPTKTEVLNTLSEMLTSPRFSTAATQSNVLRFVVESALSNTPITEVDIALATAAQFDAESHKVRANVSIIRRKIKAYYANEGAHELVKIALPPGPSYKADFAYNFDAHTIRTYQRGLAHRNKFTRLGFTYAIHLLRGVKAESPRFVPVHCALVETVLLASIWDHVFSVSSPVHWSTSEEANELLSGLQACPQSWNTNVLLGAAALFSFKYSLSRDYFEKAKLLNGTMCYSSLWFACYLMTEGNVPEALDIAQSHAHKNPASEHFQLVYIFFLYAAGQFKAAAREFHSYPEPYPKDPLFYVITMLIELEVGDSEEAVGCIDQIPDVNPDLVGCVRRPFEGAHLLAISKLNRKDLLETEWEKLSSEEARCKATWAERRHIVPLRGERLYDEYKAATKRRPLQWAIACIATRRFGRALAFLRRAYKEQDIILVWANLLPIFTPLRGNPRFQELIKSISK